MKRPVVTVTAIIPFGEAIIMIRRANAPYLGRWSLPVGHVEFGERLDEAVIREVEEELGLKTVVERFIGFKNYRCLDKARPYHYVVFCFECRVVSNDIHPGKEVLEAALVNPKKPGFNIMPAIRSFLSRAGYI